MEIQNTNQLSLYLAEINQAASNVINASYWPTVFMWIKISAIIISLGMLIALIMLISKSSILHDRLEEVSFLLRPKNHFKNRLAREWQKAKNLLDEDTEVHRKLAVAEADKIFSGLIKEIGFAGKDTDEKINNIKSYQLTSIDKLKEARLARNEIVRRPDMALNKEDAENIINIYETAMKDLGGLD